MQIFIHFVPFDRFKMFILRTKPCLFRSSGLQNEENTTMKLSVLVNALKFTKSGQKIGEMESAEGSILFKKNKKLFQNPKSQKMLFFCYNNPPQGFAFGHFSLHKH